MSWASMNYKERGRWIRFHAQVPHTDLRRLFCLTEEGLAKILDGDMWLPAYEAAA